MAFTKPRTQSFEKRKSIQQRGKQALLKRKDNAATGYAHRQNLKDKKREKESGDVYEYVQEKTRRSKVQLDLDRDEAMEFGGLDGMDDGEKEALRARLIGENEDDEKVDSDDDEEVDSDAAFEESDEERFAGFFSNKKKKPASKQKGPTVRFDVDLNEDDDPSAQHGEDDEESEEEEEEEGEDDEFIDLLDVLDGKGEIDMPSDEESSTKPMPQPAGSSTRPDSDDEMDDAEQDKEEEDDEEDDDDEESEEEDFRITATDDEGDGDLDNLQNFVQALDTTAHKRKAPDEGEPSQQKHKRRMIPERTETGAEDEFRVNATGSKLDLDDLLGPLANQSSALMSLKRTNKVLGSASKAQALSAPLPQRAQEKLDREAAYEQTKEEVDKWSNTMKCIREADHLSFPLQAEKVGRVSNLELSAKFKPTTALESAVDALLKSAKVREEDIQETEESILKANNLSVEEVAQRRAELRKMRELMYRAEVKAKRVKKIKSKTYRKIKRKEREKMADKIDEENSDDEEVRMKRELERARERATLRHKHTGKWARQMQNKHLDEDQRKEIEEMLDKGDKLRRRIQGVGSDDESDEEVGSSDGGDEDESLDSEQAMASIKAASFNELQKLKNADGVAEVSSGKSIFEMKFMKDAMARKQKAANQEVDELMKEFAADGTNSDGDADEGEPHEQDASGVIVQRIGGRVIYRPGAPSTSRAPHVQPPPSDTSSVTLKSSDLLSPVPVSPLIEPSFAKSTGSSNPWLQHEAIGDSSNISRKVNEVVVSKDSKSAEKSKNKLKKEARKRGEERQQVKDDTTLDISMDNVLQLEKPVEKSPAQKSKMAKSATGGNSDDSDDNSEVDAQEQELLKKSKGKGKAAAPTAFQQRDLIALAFAGDNVVREFEESKRREIADDAPKEIDTTIPGWGSWGGTGMKWKAPKPERMKKVAGVDPTTRADYNKKHIIISEKRDKKASKYLVTDLPYPFTSQAQFERSMERPLGAQWNTRVAFQRATLPRVVKKPGVVITALKKAT